MEQGIQKSTNRRTDILPHFGRALKGFIVISQIYSFRCSTPARGGSRAGSPTRANGINLPINQRPMTGELSFAVRPALGGRKGWMIMPDNGGGTEEDGGDPDALQRVVEMIKEMELCGHAVPERITIKVWSSFGCASVLNFLFETEWWCSIPTHTEKKVKCINFWARKNIN